jgi:integrase
MTEKSAASRVRLTDARLKATKATGKRYVLWDASVPGLGARVTATGAVSFVSVKRQPGARNWTWLALGSYPELSLAKAREKAQVAISLLASGQNPREIEAKRRADSVLAVAEDFLKRSTGKLRSKGDVEFVIRRYLLGQERDGDGWTAPSRTGWAARPITSIERRDVVDLLEGMVERGHRHQARKVMIYIGRFFDWAILKDYGLTHSPADRVRPRDIIGKLDSRDRVLSDSEFKSIWNAADAMAYPFGPMVKLLSLTGCRLREIAEARWTEINGDALTIPPERAKTGEANVVPLTKSALALLESLPRFGGDYIFTTQAGARPVSGFGKAKDRLDKTIATLGEGRVLADWRFHDIRRSVRTKLSALGVRDDVAEMVLGHKLRGVRGVYDRHRYDTEKRDALTRWEIALNAIVIERPDNIVTLRPRVSEKEGVQTQLASPSASPDPIRSDKLAAN